MGKISGFGKNPVLQRRKPGSEFQSKPRTIGFLFKQLSKKKAFYGLTVVSLIAVALYGTVDFWAESLVVLLICLAACLRAADYLTGKTEFFFQRDTILLLTPLIGILILGALQIVPVGGGVISEDIYATKRFILMFTALIIFLEILLFYTTSRKELKALVTVVIAAGAGSAFLGVMRDFFGVQENSFLSAYFTDGIGYAQYINRNHFMFLIEMTLGLLCGLTLKGNLNEKQKFASWLLSGLLILVAISVNSRGGLLSLAGLYILAFVLHFLTKRHRRFSERGSKTPVWVTISKAAAVGAIVFAIGVFTVAFVGGDQVVSRIEKINGEVEFAESRGLQRGRIWNSTTRLIAENPVFGVGFGAYGAAITRFDDSGGGMSLQQAHNDYLEILANGGVATLLLTLVFAIFVARKIFARLSATDGFERGSAFGAMLGLIAVLIHSMVEFGLHAFGNALIFVILIVIGGAKIETNE